MTTPLVPTPLFRTGATFACLAVKPPSGALTDVGIAVGLDCVDDGALALTWQPAQRVAEFADLAFEPRSILRRH